MNLLNITQGNKKYKYLLILLCSIYFGLNFYIGEVHIIELSLFFCFLTFILILEKYCIHKKLKFILLSSFVIRSILAFINLHIVKLQDTGVDAINYHKTGLIISKAISSNIDYPADTYGLIYSKTIGYIYYATGNFQFIPILLNIVLGVIIVYIVLKLVLEITNNLMLAKLGAIITAFYPLLCLYSSILRRENIITTTMLLSIYYFIKWTKHSSKKYLLITSVFWILSTLYHEASLFIVFPFVFIYSFYNIKTKVWNFYNKKVLLSSSLMIGIYFLIRDNLSEKIPNNFFDILTPSFISWRLQQLPVGRTNYLVDIIPSSYIDLILQTPMRVAHFLFSPFIWSVSTFKDLLGTIDGLIYLVIIFMILLNLQKILRHTPIQSLVIFLILFVQIIIFSWGVTNTGTAIRHRQKLLPLFISLSLCINYSKEKSQKN